MSILLKVTEEFLAAQSVRQNKVSRNIKLLDIYKKRNLSKHFESGARQIEELQSERNSSDPFYHYHQYRIEMQREMFLDQKEGRRKVTGLQKVSDHLDSFYLINKLKQCCAMVSHRNVFGQQYDLKMMDEVLAHLKTNRYDIPLLNLYHSGLLTLVEPEDESHFTELKKNLAKHLSSFIREEASDLHLLARNYAIKRLNTGDGKYVRELLDLYKLGLNTVVLDENGVMPPGSFKNIVAVGLKLKEYKWTEKFIREYSQKMEEQYQKDYQNYNLAKLFFEKREYNKVTDLLLNVEYKDIFIAVDARTLLIKTYYEMGEYGMLDSQLDSFKQFVRRKKELAYHARNYLNTVRFTKKLMSMNGSGKEAERLRKKIADETMLTEKAWLTEKLKDLTGF